MGHFISTFISANRQHFCLSTYEFCEDKKNNSRVPDQNGISQAWYRVGIYNVGPEPSNYVPACFPQLNPSDSKQQCSFNYVCRQCTVKPTVCTNQGHCTPLFGAHTGYQLHPPRQPQGIYYCTRTDVYASKYNSFAKLLLLIFFNELLTPLKGRKQAISHFKLSSIDYRGSIWYISTIYHCRDTPFLVGNPRYTPRRYLLLNEQSLPILNFLLFMYTYGLAMSS